MVGPSASVVELPRRPSSDADTHSFVVSDLHLADEQPHDPRRPLWKRFKARDLFVDASFGRWLEHIQELCDGPIELILNGDIFDFDSVMAIPDPAPFPVSWLERRRGLDPEEPKSRFKMSVILADHAGFVDALRSFLAAGHRVVFVIGNHDIELHWPAVQEVLREALSPPGADRDALRFCEWFYVSGGDTLVAHGNQFDRYCVCVDPVHPLVRVHGRDRVRLPFGNLAGKYMLNGMGLFNPHVESSFIRSVGEYVVFFVRYMLRVQPLLAWTWLWTAMVTLEVTLREGFLPALRDPFTLEDRVRSIARRSNATPGQVRALRTLHAHPALFHPLQIARELWLDRAIALALILLGTFQLFSVLNVFVSLPAWWWPVFFVLALPPFIFYARGVNSDVKNYEHGLHHWLPSATRIVGVRRVVLGHTHLERHVTIEGLELLNTGTWSPAFHDVECREPFGRKCFAWLRPGPGGRSAELREWRDPSPARGSEPEPVRESAHASAAPRE